MFRYTCLSVIASVVGRETAVFPAGWGVCVRAGKVHGVAVLRWFSPR